MAETRAGGGKVIRVPGNEEPSMFHGAAFARAKVRVGPLSGFDEGETMDKSMLASARDATHARAQLAR